MMMRPANVLRPILIAGLLVLTSCKKPQSFEEAMRVACEYPELPAVRSRIDALPAEQRGSALTKEVKERVTNAEARKLLFETVAPSKEERDTSMKKAVKRAGLARCWMTDPVP